MYRTASYPKVGSTTTELSARSFALVTSLLLAAVSYVLLLAVPHASRHFRGLAGSHEGLRAVDSWLPVASVTGLALGGCAALVFVLLQVAREVERRPYTALAPVLAVFVGCILIGLRAPLPLPGVSAEHVAVFSLAVSVLGGALVSEPRLATQLSGLLFTVLPSLSLLMVLWTVSGEAALSQAIWSLPATTRAFLVMLAVSSLAIALLAVLGRRHASSAPSAEPARVSIAAQADAVMAEAYRLEQSYAADERALARRGLPIWLLVCLSVLAVAAGFFAFKVFMVGRSSGSAAQSAVATPAHVRVAEQVGASPATTPDSSERLAGELSTAPTVTSLAVHEPQEAPLKQPLPTLGAAAIAPGAPPESAPQAAEPAAVLELQVINASPRELSARAPESTLRQRTESRRRPRANLTKNAAAASRDKLADRAAKAAKPQLEKESEPAQRTPATRKAKAAQAATEKAPTTRGDESLDELMDNIVKSKRQQKTGVVAGDDPIFGL